MSARAKRFVDLFAGIGGFHFAAAGHGLAPVLAAEIDVPAAAQYQAATGFAPVGDVCDLSVADVPDHDLLLAGFPCQPYSIIGDRQGLEDTRGAVIEEVFRILEGKRPAAFVLENVRQLVTHADGATLRYLKRRLQAAGYSVLTSVLNALDYGVPQKRERVFIVGLRSTLQRAIQSFAWPMPGLPRPSLAEILEPDDAVDARHWLSPAIRDHVQAHHTAQVRPAIWHQNKGGNISSHPFSCALRANASYNYLMVNGERRLTEREMLRLQGFPEDFPIHGCYGQVRKQCGNAVPVPMASAVIKAVLHALH